MSATSGSGGYACPLCGTWVSFGGSHNCLGYRPGPHVPQQSSHQTVDPLAAQNAALNRIAAAIERLVDALARKEEP